METLVELCMYVTMFAHRDRAHFLELLNPFFQGPEKQYPKTKIFVQNIYHYLYNYSLKTFKEISQTYEHPKNSHQRKNQLTYFHFLEKNEGEIFNHMNCSLIQDIFHRAYGACPSIYDLFYALVHRDISSFAHHSLKNGALNDEEIKFMKVFNTYNALFLLEKLTEKKKKKYFEYTCSDSDTLGNFLSSYDQDLLNQFSDLNEQLLRTYLDQNLSLHQMKLFSVYTLSQMNHLIKNKSNLLYENVRENTCDNAVSMNSKQRKNSKKQLKKGFLKPGYYHHQTPRLRKAFFYSWLENYMSHLPADQTLKIALSHFDTHKDFFFSWLSGSFSYSFLGVSYFQDADYFDDQIQKTQNAEIAQNAHLNPHQEQNHLQRGDFLKFTQAQHSNIKNSSRQNDDRDNEEVKNQELSDDCSLREDKKQLLKRKLGDLLFKRIQYLKKYPYMENFLFEHLSRILDELQIFFNPKNFREKKLKLTDHFLQEYNILLHPFLKRLLQAHLWTDYSNHRKLRDKFIKLNYCVQQITEHYSDQFFHLPKDEQRLIQFSQNNDKNELIKSAKSASLEF